MAPPTRIHQNIVMHMFVILAVLNVHSCSKCKVADRSGKWLVKVWHQANTSDYQVNGSANTSDYESETEEGSESAQSSESGSDEAEEDKDKEAADATKKKDLFFADQH